ncbi:hypothetical protein [Micromonospora vulcania]|uniref:Uncharacterized protein n=1 Tax=Micromonospora vulcania TaxID=1441873 RepID=A0ABW1HFB2_9ACTN
MLTYYAIYRMDEKGDPAGLFIMDVGFGQAILWDHRAQAWSYDPDLVVRFLDDYRNIDRYRTVDRATAEGVALAVTGGVSLPDEQAIRGMFAAAGGASPHLTSGDQ